MTDKEIPHHHDSVRVHIGAATTKDLKAERNALMVSEIVNVECAERRELLGRYEKIQTIGARFLFREVTISAQRAFLSDPENQDHGVQHTESLLMSSVDFKKNVWVKNLSASEFVGSLPFVRSWIDAVFFHDLLQAFHQKQGHDGLGAIFYHYASLDLTRSLRNGGELYTNFLDAENKFKMLVRQLYDRDNGKLKIPDGSVSITSAQRDDLIYLARLTQQENWTDETRIVVYHTMGSLFDVLAQSTAIKHRRKEEKEMELLVEMCSEYTGMLCNYLMTDEQRNIAATMIMNHGSPERIVREGVYKFSVSTAVNLALREMKIEPGKNVLGKIFRKFNTLEQYAERISADYNPPDELVNENTKTAETLTKWFTAEDLYWTVFPGMQSVIRTVVTSSKRFGIDAKGQTKVRPIFVPRKKEGKSSLIPIMSDFSNRSRLTDHEGNPLDASHFPDDLTRIVAESALPFEKLCSDEWFLNRIGLTYEERFMAFRQFMLSLITGNFNMISKAYSSYANEDLKLYIENLRLLRVMTHNEIYSTVALRYADELKLVKQVWKDKRIMRGFPKKNRWRINSRRINELLDITEHKISLRFPIQNRERLLRDGYDLEETQLPHLIIPNWIFLLARD